MSDYKWKKQNTVFITVNFNKNTDADIIATLSERSNKQGFIRNSIRYYIANGCPEMEKDKTDEIKSD